MSQIVGLFPTPLLRAERLLPPSLVASLLDRYAGAAQAENSRSAQLAHTQMLSTRDSPELSDVAACVAPKLVEFGELLFGEALPWAIKELWINRLETGGHQALHNHANSFVSGVIYLTASDASASTVFVKSLGASGFVFGNAHADTRSGSFNADRWIMPEVAAGDLVLFPSYLLHEVPRNAGGVRVTLAFNAIPRRLDSWGYAIGFTR